MADNTEDDADKGKSQVSGNWFGNIVYWFIGAFWMSAVAGPAG